MMELCPSSQWRGPLEKAFDFAQAQVRGLINRDPDFYPMYTQNGRWRHSGEAWTHWCDGFLPGMMWIFHHRTKDLEWKKQAERYTTPLEPRKMDRNVHDLGFIFLSTYHRWYRQTGDARLNDVVVQAGRTLALRFKEKGEYLSSFMGPESTFIDIMANVGLIFYAARETGDRQLLDVAMKHCLSTRRVPHPRRRQLFSRRHLRSEHGGVSAAVHPARLPRGFLLVAGPGLGNLWLRGGLPLHARPAFPANR